MAEQFKARPTEYKGIMMRSRLEAGFAMWLDRWKLDWDYEPCAFATEQGQYLPDFRLNSVEVIGHGSREVYVEVKRKAWDGCPGELLDQMLLIEESKPDCRLLLVIPGEYPYMAWYIGRNRPGVGPLKDWCRMTWTYVRPGNEANQLGLATPLFPEHHPWPDGYWKKR